MSKQIQDAYIVAAVRTPVAKRNGAFRNVRPDDMLAKVLREVVAKVPNLDGNEIVSAIAPGPRDIVVYKQKPSGFFGTNLASYLTLLGCDSVIITGTTTSGCVRATVLDAFSLNYRVAVVEEGCFDRSQASHAINLCDMNAKYADVVKTDEVLSFFDTIEPGQFNLPAGAPVSVPNLSPA